LIFENLFLINLNLKKLPFFGKKFFLLIIKKNVILEKKRHFGKKIFFY